MDKSAKNCKFSKKSGVSRQRLDEIRPTMWNLQYLKKIIISFYIFLKTLVWFLTYVILKFSLSDCNSTRILNHLVRERTPNHLVKQACLAKWLSVRLRTKWLWVRVQLRSLKLQISRLLRARSSLTFRQLQSVDSL